MAAGTVDRRDSGCSRNVGLGITQVNRPLCQCYDRILLTLTDEYDIRVEEIFGTICEYMRRNLSATKKLEMGMVWCWSE
jgi:hypothetical protein